MLVRGWAHQEGRVEWAGGAADTDVQPSLWVVRVEQGGSLDFTTSGANARILIS